MQLTKSFRAFFESEKSGGLLLIIVTLLSIALANSAFQLSYTRFWNIEFAGHNLVHWINDGLMTIFFLLIGLELEREIYQGELSTLKNAMLPMVTIIALNLGYVVGGAIQVVLPALACCKLRVVP